MAIFRKKKENAPSDNGTVSSPEAGSERFFREVDIEFLIHELKDPVAIIETGIRTLLERKEKYGPLTPKQEKTLQRTLRNAKKARGMLRNLLEIGRSQSGCFVPCRFKPAAATYQALSDALETTAWRVFEQFCSYEGNRDALNYLSGCGITLNAQPRIWDLEMNQDETKFCQIVGNLIKNALHYRRERLDISLEQKGEYLFLKVTDDGPGIDPAHHKVIFQRYSRLKECTITARDGHGLGLAGARILARCMGGDIEVTSEKGQGTAFRLMMPLSMGVTSQ